MQQIEPDIMQATEEQMFELPNGVKLEFLSQDFLGKKTSGTCRVFAQTIWAQTILQTP